MRRMTPTEKLVHNERLKLRANALNTLGTSYFTIGALAPLVNLTFGSPAHTQPWYIYVLFLPLQLHFVLSSESMGNHDSGYDEWRYVC